MIKQTRYMGMLVILLMASGPAMTQEKGAEKMTHHIEGSFSVKLTPQSDEDASPGIGRMLINKEYQGDLAATGRGQMLTGMTAVKGSAGYVAMEWVKGTLKGHTGSFLLQHSGTMAGGDQELVITVVPDSGTDELKGLQGRMDIKIEDGQHFYRFDYSLPDQR